MVKAVRAQSLSLSIAMVRHQMRAGRSRAFQLAKTIKTWSACWSGHYGTDSCNILWSEHKLWSQSLLWAQTDLRLSLHQERCEMCEKVHTGHIIIICFSANGLCFSHQFKLFPIFPKKWIDQFGLLSLSHCTEGKEVSPTHAISVPHESSSGWRISFCVESTLLKFQRCSFHKISEVRLYGAIWDAVQGNI